MPLSKSLACLWFSVTQPDLWKWGRGMLQYQLTFVNGERTSPGTDGGKGGDGGDAGENVHCPYCLQKQYLSKLAGILCNIFLIIN